MAVLIAFLAVHTIPGTLPAYAGETKPAEIPKHENTNVIFISIDTLRQDHLGCYGYERNTSENIDRYAKEAVVFENFITQAALTPISQMSIFTSQHPRVNGMASYEFSVKEVTEQTFPAILKYYGYTNAAFVGSPEFYQTRKARDASSSREHETIFAKSFDIFAQSQYRDIPGQSLDWIKANKDKKFFLWIPIGTVHWPYSDQVLAPYRTKYDPPGYVPFFNRYERPDINNQNGAIEQDLLFHIYQKTCYVDSASPYHLSKEDTQYIISRYDAGIYYTDMFIGRLLALLDELKLKEKTLVVVHSIHGEDLGEHGYFYHYDIYDTEVKNALIVRFPGGEFGGKRISPQAQGIDIMPTVLNYLNIPVNHQAQGTSLMPLIKTGQDSNLNEFVYTTRTPVWEYTLSRGQKLSKMAKQQGITPRDSERLLGYRDMLQKHFEKYDPHYPPYDIAIRTNKWKLIVRKNAPLLGKVSLWSFVSGKEITIEESELYDLENDPFEQKNLASERPDIAGTLKAKVLEWDASIERQRPNISKGGDRIMIPYPN